MSDSNSQLELVDSGRQSIQHIESRPVQRRNIEPHDLGIYKNCRLTGFEPGKTEGKLIRLVYYDQNRKRYQVEDDALQFLQRFSAYEVAFVSIVGQKNNGKSFILDKVLNLAGVRGNHFSLPRPNGLYMWSQPFRKRNLKIFLLDVEGFKTQGVTHTEAKMHTLLMLLCSSILFNHRSKSGFDDYHVFQSLMKNTFQTISHDSRRIMKDDRITPRSLYHLYRNRALASGDMIQFFNHYDYTFLEDAMSSNYRGNDSDLIQCPLETTSIINQKFIRHLSDIFNSVLNIIEQKTINSVTFNGNIVSKMIREVVQWLNKSEHLDIDKVFKTILQELYVSAFNYSIITYSDVLSREFQDESAKSLQELLDIFGRACDETMKKYNEFNLDPELHRQYLKKLQEHIALKEDMLMQINQKKTEKILSQQIEKLQKPKDIESCIAEIDKFNQKTAKLNHGKEEIMASLMVRWMEHVSKNLGNGKLQIEVDELEGKLKNLRKQHELQQQRSKDVTRQLNQLKSQLKEKQKTLNIATQNFDAKVKKMQSVTHKRVSVGNIDEIRTDYEAKLKSNSALIEKLQKQLSDLQKP